MRMVAPSVPDPANGGSTVANCGVPFIKASGDSKSSAAVRGELRRMLSAPVSTFSNEQSAAIGPSCHTDLRSATARSRRRSMRGS